MIINKPKIIRWGSLKDMFDGNISRSTIDRWIKEKKFPDKIDLGKNSVGWVLIEVEEWFNEKCKKNS